MSAETWTLESHILDHIARAVKRGQAEGEAGIRAYFREEMTSVDHARFDRFLVKMGDDLAWMEGSTERRFVTRCGRMLRNLEGGS
jgi:hypothetical protein